MKQRISIPALLNSNLDDLNFNSCPISSMKKPLRKRIGFLQTKELIVVFDSGIKFPNKYLRERLSEKLGLTPRTVQVWFQNRRQNEKTATNIEESEEIQMVSILQCMQKASK